MSARRLSSTEANHALDLLIKLALKIDTLQSESAKALDEGDEDEAEAKQEKARKLIESVLIGVCRVIRSLEISSYQDAEPVLTRASSMVDDLVREAYGDEWSTHDFPLLSDSMKGRIPGMGTDMIDMLMARMFGIGGAQSNTGGFPGIPQPMSYDPSNIPHQRTTPLSRFRPSNKINPSFSSIPSNAPLALAVYQARCSIVTTDIHNPISMSLPQNSSILALAGAGGWKERSPFLSCFNVGGVGHTGGEGKYREFPEHEVLEVPLASVAHWVDVDSARKLVWVADQKRVKSFRYNAKSSTNNDELLAVHTLKAPGGGPIALLNDGAKFLKGGNGNISVWDVDALPTHGVNGKKRIGKKIRTDDTWRDEPDEIEASEGAHPSATISIMKPATSTSTPSSSSSNDASIQPTSWITSPSSPTTLILARTKSYGLISIDISSGSEGKIDMTYLGHGGNVTAFSTSKEGDPRTFVTSASDGIVRLWDVRQPLPRLSLDVGDRSESCSAVCYAHVQGVPIIYTGGTRSESIKAWDPRSSTRNCIYELSTGNNAVMSLAWDAPRTTLYAATECTYMDRLGGTHDYRVVRRRKNRNANNGDDDEEMSEDEDDDEDDDEDGDKGWPSDAFHDESYYGYLWDCGCHRLIKYTFGEEADPQILPVYGDAMPGGSDMFGW